MAMYLEACILYREIYARQRMDTKLNPGLEAVYLCCSKCGSTASGTSTLFFSQHSTKRCVVDTASFSLSLMLTMRIRSQHMEYEKSRQKQGTVFQILLKKKE